MGAAPPSMAKAASVRQRPGWDQAHSTVAATIGPTPVRVSRSGRQARTSARMAWRWSAASAGQLPDAAGQGCAGSPRWWRSRRPSRPGCAAGRRQRPAGGCERDPEPFPEGSGAAIDQRMELALGVAGGLDRGAAGGQPHRERCSWAGRSGLGELVAAQGLAGGPGGVQGVGLGEDEHIFVDDQMRWLTSGSGLAGLGELPERWPRHQAPMSDRGVQGEDVLQIPKSGLVGELHGGGREIIKATGAAGVLGHRDQQPTGAQYPGAADQDLCDPCAGAGGG